MNEPATEGVIPSVTRVGRDVARAVMVAAVVVAAALQAPPPARAADRTEATPARTWLLAWEGPHVRQTDLKPFALSAFHAPTVREQTIRQVVRPAAEGSRVRLRFSNREADHTVTFGRVTVALLHASGPAIVAGSVREARFDGDRELVLFPGQDAESDPVDLTVGARQSLAIDIHVRSAARPYSGHSMHSDLSWVSPPMSGDRTGDLTGAVMPITGNATAWLHSVDVFTTPRPVVVVLGDSTSAGYVPAVRYEWPLRLAERVGPSAAVVTSARVANNLTRSHLCEECNPSISERLEHDALDRAGVTDLIVFAGTNDITQLTPVRQLTAGLEDIVRRAHARGIRVIGATVTPRQDWYHYYQPTVMGPMRHELNNWIRMTDVFDGTVDFDLAIRDPLNHEQMWPPYDSGDRMHPNVLGMRHLADTVPLELFVSRSESAG